MNEAATSALASYRAHAEGLPHGGRIERHVHEQDQLALIAESAAVIETDDSYVVHPLSKALWLPAGVYHAVYSSRPFERHAHALALLTTLLAEAKTESFVLPRPRSERARKLANHLATRPDDSRALEIVADEIGGASLRTFERLFVEETGMTLAVWRRHSRLLTSLTFLAEGKSIAETAHAVGYDSTAAFSTAFKQCFGFTPKAYAGEKPAKT